MATTPRKFDTPGVTDNRDYDYSASGELDRAEYPIIESWVPAGSRVLDLGCGNGSLLRRLARKGITGVGWDSSVSGIAACRQAGLNAEVRQIDRLHPDVADAAFDFAICNVTIQMTTRPEILLAEMARLAHRQIVSFPNFAHYRNRVDLLIRGRMPRPLLFGYEWYSTGHIHQLSVSDFYRLVDAIGGTRVLRKASVPSRTPIGRFLRSTFPNMFEVIPIFLLGR
jgi:methionine biosynthesis protein MetW